MPSDIKFKIGAKDSTKRAFKSVQDNLAGINGKLVRVTGLIAGAVGVAGFGALVKSSLDAGDALAKTADKIGITTEKLASLNHMTNLYTSAGAGAMAEALTKATKRLGEFNATGGGAAAKWLEKLNLDTRELASLSPDVLFERYSESIRGLNSRGEQLAAISALMGDESRQLIGIVDQMPEALAQSALEAEALGIALSRVDAAKMEAANDSFTKLKGITAGIGNTLAVQLSPFLEAAANSITKMAVEAGGFDNIAASAMENVATAVGFVADAFNGLQLVWQGLRVLFAGMLSGWLNGLNKLQEGITGFINMIPGVDVTPFQGLADIAEAADQSFISMQANLSEMLLSPPPSDNIKAVFEEVKLAAEETAVAVAEAAPGGSSEEENIAKQEMAAEQNATMETIAAKHEKTLTKIKNKGLTDRQKFEKLTTMAQTRFVLGNLTNLLGQAAQHSKAFFKMNKIAGIANAIVNTAEGVTKSLSAYPFPINAVMAAATAAAGLAQIKTIKSQSYSGGGAVTAPVQTTSVPSLPDQLAGGGSLTSPSSSELLNDPAAVAPQQSVSLNLGDEDELISVSAMRSFLERAQEVAEDMGPNTKIVIA